MYSIEKVVVIPPSRPGAKYPFNEMEVGDSFYIETTKETQVKLTAGAAVAMYQYNKTFSPKKFVKRKVDGGFRIWRIN